VSTSGAGVLNTDGSTRMVAGAALHPFEHWAARGPSLVQLPVGGTMRLTRGTIVQGVDGHALALTSGRAYFDFPPGARSFVLHTTIGTIEHVGTQFEVMQS